MTPWLRNFVVFTVAAYAQLLRAEVPALNFKRVALVNGSALKFEVASSGGAGQIHTVDFVIQARGQAGWQAVGDVLVLGPDDQVEQSWVAKPGVYRLRARIDDIFVDSQAELSFEVFTEQRQISNGDVLYAVNRSMQRVGSIATSDGILVLDDLDKELGCIFWSGGQASLTRGFTAPEGTFFWAVTGSASLYRNAENVSNSDRDKDKEFGTSDDDTTPAAATKIRGTGSAAVAVLLANGKGGAAAKSKSARDAALANSEVPASLVLHRPNGILVVNPATLEGSR